MKKTPYKIEKYFSESSILNERVKNQFSIYRKEWRNPSTHNHKLYFNKEEAFMAILNVSSFIYVLSSQLLSLKSYEELKNRDIMGQRIEGFNFEIIVNKMAL